MISPTTVARMYKIMRRNDRDKFSQPEGTSLLRDFESESSLLCLPSGRANLMLHAVNENAVHSTLTLDLPKEHENQIISSKVLFMDRCRLLVGLLTASGSFVEIDLSNHFANGVLPEVVSGKVPHITSNQSDVQKKISLYDLSTKQQTPIQKKATLTSELPLDKVLAAADIFLDLNLELICHPLAFSRGLLPIATLRGSIFPTVIAAEDVIEDRNRLLCLLSCTNGYLAFGSFRRTPKELIPESDGKEREKQKGTQTGPQSMTRAGRAGGAGGASSTSSTGGMKRRGSKTSDGLTPKSDIGDDGQDDSTVTLIKCCNDDITEALSVPFLSEHTSYDGEKKETKEEHVVYLRTHASPGLFLYFPSGRKVCCNYNYSSRSLSTASNGLVDDSSQCTSTNMHAGVDADADTGVTATGIGVGVDMATETTDAERGQELSTIVQYSTDESDLQETSATNDTATDTTAAAAAVTGDDNNNESDEPVKEDDIWRECSSDEESSEAENESKPDVGGPATATTTTAPTATTAKPSVGLRGRATQGTAKLQIHAASEGTVAFLLVPQLSSLTIAGVRSRPWLSGVDKPGFITREEETKRRNFKPVPVSLASCARLLGKPAQALRVLNEAEVHRLRAAAAAGTTSDGKDEDEDDMMAAGVLDELAGLLYVYLVQFEGDNNLNTEDGLVASEGRSGSKNKAAVQQQLRYGIPESRQTGQYKVGLYAAAPEPHLVAPCFVVDLRWLLHLDGPMVKEGSTVVEVVDQVLVLSESLVATVVLKQMTSTSSSSSALDSATMMSSPSPLGLLASPRTKLSTPRVELGGEADAREDLEVPVGAKFIICTLDGLHVQRRCQLSPGENAVQMFDGLYCRTKGGSRIQQSLATDSATATATAAPMASGGGREVGAGESRTTPTATRRATASAAREVYVATNYNMYRITEHSHTPANCDIRPSISTSTDTHTTPVTGTALTNVCDKRVSTDILGALTSSSSSLKFLDKRCYHSLVMMAQNNGNSSSSGSAAQKRSSSAFNSVKSKFESQGNSNAASAPSSSALKKTPTKTGKHNGDSATGNKGINSSLSPRTTASSIVTKVSEDSNRRQSISSPRTVGAASASLSTLMTSPKDSQKTVPISRRGSTSTSTSSTSKEKRPSAEPPAAIIATALPSSRSGVSTSVLACLCDREKLDFLLSNRDIIAVNIDKLGGILPLLTVSDCLSALPKLGALVDRAAAATAASSVDEMSDLAFVSGMLIITALHKMVESIRIQTVHQARTPVEGEIYLKLSGLVETMLQLPICTDTRTTHTTTQEGLQTVLHALSPSQLLLDIDDASCAGKWLATPASISQATAVSSQLKSALVEVLGFLQSQPETSLEHSGEEASTKRPLTQLLAHCADLNCAYCACLVLVHIPSGPIYSPAQGNALMVHRLVPLFVAVVQQKKVLLTNCAGKSPTIVMQSVETTIADDLWSIIRHVILPEPNPSSGTDSSPRIEDHRMKTTALAHILHVWISILPLSILEQRALNLINEPGKDATAFRLLLKKVLFDNAGVQTKPMEFSGRFLMQLIRTV